MSELERRADRGAEVLGIAGVRTTSTTLEIVDPNISLDEWGTIGEKASSLIDVGKFWLGDWLLFGNDRFNERYAQAASITNRSEGGLRNICSVCRRVARDVRRSELSFSHHEEVAAMPRAEQIRWLAYAVDNELNVAAFRAHIRATKERALKEQRVTTSLPPGAPEHSPQERHMVEPLALPVVPASTPCESAWDDVLSAVAAAKKARAGDGDWTEALRRLRVKVENAQECDELEVVEATSSRKPPWA